MELRFAHHHAQMFVIVRLAKSQGERDRRSRPHLAARVFSLVTVSASDFMHHLFLIECSPIEAEVKASWKKANCTQYESLKRISP